MVYTAYKVLAPIASFLGRDDIASSLSVENLDENYNMQTETKFMLDALNWTAIELAEEHFPLLFSEAKTTDQQCCVPISGFTKMFYRLIRVKDDSGYDTTFRTFPDFIKLSKPNSQFSFVYQYLPNITGLTAQFEMDSRVTQRILIFGACAVYCLANGLYDEAKMWDARYQDAIFVAKHNGEKDKRFKNSPLY